MNNSLILREGLMVIVSSPSGAGKTTLTRKLVNELDDAVLSISVTTRKKRANEEEGLHYFFLEEKQFINMKENNELLEHANVFGYFYGTPKNNVLESVQSGKDVVFDIDWQGAKQLRSNFHSNIISIFILPPSASELMSRLIKRDQDSFDTIKKRITAAYDEITHWNEYDYVIINDNLESAYSELKAIILSERLKISDKNRDSIDSHVQKLLIDLENRLEK
tara:strand:+ start:7314 stop:7976 length:663 start_codon:yes stop_codon:yes gene_type:complete